MNESTPITELARTSKAGLTLYRSSISRTPTAIAAVSLRVIHETTSKKERDRYRRKAFPNRGSPWPFSPTSSKPRQQSRPDGSRSKKGNQHSHSPNNSSRPVSDRDNPHHFEAGGHLPHAVQVNQLREGGHLWTSTVRTFISGNAGSRFPGGKESIFHVGAS